MKTKKPSCRMCEASRGIGHRPLLNMAQATRVTGATTDRLFYYRVMPWGIAWDFTGNVCSKCGMARPHRLSRDNIINVYAYHYGEFYWHVLLEAHLSERKAKPLIEWLGEQLSIAVARSKKFDECLLRHWRRPDFDSALHFIDHQPWMRAELVLRIDERFTPAQRAFLWRRAGYTSAGAEP